MAEDKVNPRITNAVTMTNLMVVGMSPSVAVGSLYQTIANSVALASMNAVYAQQQSRMVQQAATAQEVAKILSISFQ